jgi:putative flippase GtrA
MSYPGCGHSEAAISQLGIRANTDISVEQMDGQAKISARTSRLVRWILVGAVNTAWGLAIIVLLYFVCGISMMTSNLMAYLSGAVISYLLNRRFTFNAKHAGVREFIQFAFCQAVALGIMILAVNVMTALDMPFIPIQIVTLIMYSITFFMLSEFIVFRRHRDDSEFCDPLKS